MLWLLIAAILIPIVGWCLLRVRHDYRERKSLSSSTAVIVWMIYLVHFALTAVAAWQRAWPLGLPEAVAVTAGSGLMILGAIVFTAAVARFASLRLTSGVATDRLVTGGIYRWSRNPQNVGWVLFLAGVSLIGDSGAALLLNGLFCVMFRAYIPIEEEFLESVFGDDYRSYCAATHRYFGLPS